MRKRPELLATFVYLAVGALWIVFSDSLVQGIAAKSSSVTADELQLAKGLVFVGLTGVLVFFLVRSATRATQRHADELEQRIADRTEELETRNRDLTSFSYSISHDLRAPVRAVAGFSEIISRRYGDSLPDEARHYLESILTAGKRMNRLIDDLLRYARLGSTTPELKGLSLSPVVDEIAAEFEPALASLSGAFELSTGDVRVWGSRSLLEQILSNLVQNSIRYRAPDRVPEISIRASRVDGRVEVSVSDNGIGIAPEHHERIFSLFQRLQSDDYDGTGVGLALARRAAELLGGSLAVRSSPGEGSTFVLTLREAFP